MRPSFQAALQGARRLLLLGSATVIGGRNLKARQEAMRVRMGKRNGSRDPQTQGQWQEAVDAAYGALVLDSCRQYGLIEGGPEINLERCRDILERGELRGMKPAPDAAETFILALMVDNE